MKKGLLLIVWFILQSLPQQAQSLFGNEWIKPSQNYIKFSVNRSGVYRISHQDIQKADASLLSTNPANWQLFFRGQEVAIRVVGQQDGTFNTGDYIEFYGESNDGSQDSLLYRPKTRLHPYQTLYSDVATYFLTHSPSQKGKRMAELNDSAAGLSPIEFHVEEVVKAFTDEYTFNNLKGIEPPLQQSYFEPGEGWSGRLLNSDSIGLVQLKFQNRVKVNWPVELNGMINGRDFLSHRIQLQADAGTHSPLPLLNFFGFISQTFQTHLDPSTLQNEQVTLRFIPEKGGGPNQFSVTYVKVTYPQSLDMSGQRSKLFHLPATSHQSSLLTVPNAPPGALAYDITDKSTCRFLTTLLQNGQAQLVVSETRRNRNIFITDQTLTPLSIQPVRFRAEYPKEADYLIITHASLKQSAITYANYRASMQGGNHKPLVVIADSLYDAFNYGERSPLALRRFADYMLSQTAVKNLLLVGRASSYPYYVKTAADDLVPTIGYPGSDILITAGLKTYSANTPAIPTGRLNVTSNEQVLAYLTKVKQFESSTPDNLWRKHIVHISGGKSREEAESLRTAMTTLGDIYNKGLLGGQVSSFSKTAPYDKVESINLAPIVNDGVSLITFFGHAGPSVTDVNFGFASLPENGYRNQRYPLMIFNGCGVGEIFSRFNTLSTDWLLAPEKGSVAVLAHSYYSYEESTTRYLTKLYGELFNNSMTLDMPFGQVQQQLNSSLEREGINDHEVAVLLQMVLQGDPAIVLYPLPKPDYSLVAKSLYIQSSVSGSSLKSADSLRIVVPIANLGKFVADQFVELTIRQTKPTASISNTIRFSSFQYRDTLFYTVPKDETVQSIDVTIDAGNQIAELSKTNNTATFTIDWKEANTSSSYPTNLLPDVVSPTLNVFINGVVKSNGSIIDTSPRLDVYLTDENSLSEQDSGVLDVYLESCTNCAPIRLDPQSFTVTAIASNQLKISTTLTLQEGQTYQLTIFGKDVSGNRTRSPYTITLHVIGIEELITFQAYPNPAVTYTKFKLDLNSKDLPTESQLTIFNVTGVAIFDSPFPIATGDNSLFWEIKAPGMYPYRLRLTWKDGRSKTFTGKVVRQY